MKFAKTQNNSSKTLQFRYPLASVPGPLKAIIDGHFQVTFNTRQTLSVIGSLRICIKGDSEKLSTMSLQLSVHLVCEPLHIYSYIQQSFDEKPRGST